MCRGGGAGGAEGGLAVAARETSVGGQKSCHPQIIRKIENRNSEAGQSLNLKLSCLERVYQKKKKKKPFSKNLLCCVSGAGKLNTDPRVGNY